MQAHAAARAVRHADACEKTGADRHEATCRARLNKARRYSQRQEQADMQECAEADYVRHTVHARAESGARNIRRR